MKTTITILCENSVSTPLPLIGEHGLSILIENEDVSLFDTGQGLGLVHNMTVLGKKPENIDRIIISHGHYDHTGGLMLFLLKRETPVPVYIHPDAFMNRGTFRPGMEQAVNIGMSKTRGEYEKFGASFVEARGFMRISENIFSLSDVQRPDDWVCRDNRLVVIQNNEIMPDPFNDDMSLVVETDSGPVVLLGCAHAGIVEILEHLSQATGHREFHAVIGGTHLESAPEEYIGKTIEALRMFNVQVIAVSHCTGFRVAALLSREFGERFARATVGRVFSF